ncbi:MAG: Hsp20/alpha crystallin family protein [Candidatus Altiarchaeota archaeon]|nr:Hsp20/alpha crystallin family protein [Candidatus Altiarchaeota archaeon]
MKPKKGRDWLFDDFFRDFEEEFRRIEEDLSRILEGSLSEDKLGKPVVYGFSINVSPDGEPRIERFGHVPREGEPLVSDEREPLVDVIETEKEIRVVAELPGVEREDISLKVSGDVLEIDVDTAARKYHKQLFLPVRVKEDVTKATYKNGVLEVRLSPAGPRRSPSFRVNID